MFDLLLSVLIGFGCYYLLGWLELEPNTLRIVAAVAIALVISKD